MTNETHISLVTIIGCVALVLFFGCADSNASKETSSSSTLSGDTSTTSGGASALTDATQEQEETSESLYKLPSWPATAKQEEGKAYPFDEGPSDAGFVAFRKQLYRAVREKDVNQLLSMTFDTIHFSFGEMASKKNFIAAYELDTAPEKSSLWAELQKALELGGAFYDDQYYNTRSFAAPYVYSLNMLDDPYTSGVIVGEKVRLRDQPGLESNIVGSLTYDVIDVLPQDRWKKDTINGVEASWWHIKTKNGEKGYVFGQFARTPIDYRAGFREYEPGKWRMEFFIAGD